MGQRNPTHRVHNEVTARLADVRPRVWHSFALPPESDVAPDAGRVECAPPRQSAKPVGMVGSQVLVHQARPVDEFQATAVSMQPASTFESHDENGCVASLKVNAALAQLRDVLLSEQSAQVTQKN
jgi:hypothetical protein